MQFSAAKSHALKPSSLAQKAVPIAAGIAVAAVASALLNRWLAQKAERQNPPLGRFVMVHGTRLHYVERGTGTVHTVLLGRLLCPKPGRSIAITRYFFAARSMSPLDWKSSIMLPFAME